MEATLRRAADGVRTLVGAFKEATQAIQIYPGAEWNAMSKVEQAAAMRRAIGKGKNSKDEEEPN